MSSSKIGSDFGLGEQYESEGVRLRPFPRIPVGQLTDDVIQFNLWLKGFQRHNSIPIGAAIQAPLEAIKSLCSCVDNGKTQLIELYFQETAAAVRALSRLLRLRSSNLIKSYYRQVIFCLSKLMVSTRGLFSNSNDKGGCLSEKLKLKVTKDALSLASAVQLLCRHIDNAGDLQEAEILSTFFLVPERPYLPMGGSWCPMQSKDMKGEPKPNTLINLRSSINKIDVACENINSTLRIFERGGKLSQKPNGYLSRIKYSNYLQIAASYEVAQSVSNILEQVHIFNLNLGWAFAPKSFESFADGSENAFSKLEIDLVASKQQLYTKLAQLVLVTQDNSLLDVSDKLLLSKSYVQASREISNAVGSMDFILHLFLEKAILVLNSIQRELQLNALESEKSINSKKLVFGSPLSEKFSKKVSELPKKTGLNYNISLPIEDENERHEKQSLPEKIWDEPKYLSDDYLQEVYLDENGNTIGGTIRGLVERLTSHKYLDTKFNNAFLLTFRSFTTEDDLLECLIERYNIKAPSDIHPNEYEVWIKQKQNPIKVRVVNILKKVLEMHHKGTSNDSVLDKIKLFIATNSKDDIPAIKSLFRTVEKLEMYGDSYKTSRRLIPTPISDIPSPIIPKNLARMTLLEIDPGELARQLTIKESQYFNCIKSEEFLDKAWSSREASKGENIKEIIKFSNRVTSWVAHAVVTQRDLKRRSNFVKYFIRVAEECREIKNFSTLTSIMSGLNSAPVYRLKRTWDSVNDRLKSVSKELNRIMSSSKNFTEYRVLLSGTNPPCIPFLGVFLTDLTFIEDGNTNMMKSYPQLINFAKRMKAANTIQDIQKYQSITYHLKAVPEISDFINDQIKACVMWLNYIT